LHTLQRRGAAFNKLCKVTRSAWGLERVSGVKALRKRVPRALLYAIAAFSELGARLLGTAALLSWGDRALRGTRAVLISSAKKLTPLGLGVWFGCAVVSTAVAHADYWDGVDRALPVSPLGHVIAVSCHNCYGDTNAATTSQVATALSHGFDLIEFDLTLHSDNHVYVEHCDSGLSTRAPRRILSCCP